MLKEILRINAGLELGGVRAPLQGLFEGDAARAELAAQHIREAIARFC